MKLARWTIQHGININAMPLDWFDTAVGSGYYDMVKLLLENKFNINKTDNWTLDSAVRSGSYELVKLLLEYGAMKGIIRASLTAANIGYVEILKLLFQYGAQIQPEHDRALIKAFITGNDMMFNLLVENGADVNILQGDIFRRAIREDYMR